MEKSKLSSMERLANRYILAKKKYNELHDKIISQIIEKNNINVLKNLLDDYEIRTDSFGGRLNECSDEMLLLFLEKTYDFDFASKCMKFIGDIEKFQEILQDKDKYLNYNTEKIEKLIGMIEIICNAIKSKPVFYSSLNLQKNGRNKFVVGVHKKDHDVHIAWSSTRDHKYHKEIFDDMCRENFPKEFRSGGYVKVSNGNGKMINIILNGSSGDFGRYNHKILQKFKKEIKKELSKQLKSKVGLKIEISG